MRGMTYKAIFIASLAGSFLQAALSRVADEVVMEFAKFHLLEDIFVITGRPSPETSHKLIFAVKQDTDLLDKILAVQKKAVNLLARRQKPSLALLTEFKATSEQVPSLDSRFEKLPAGVVDTELQRVVREIRDTAQLTEQLLEQSLAEAARANGQPVPVVGAADGLPAKLPWMQRVPIAQQADGLADQKRLERESAQMQKNYQGKRAGP